MSDLQEPSLFDETPNPDRAVLHLEAFDQACEHRLDEHSSVSVVRGFVQGHQRVLDDLRTLHGWEQRRRWMYNRLVDEPRLTNEYVDLAAAPAFLNDIAQALSQHLGVKYDGIWMNWYRDNHDGTSWHADRPANAAPTAIVPVLSLGATRRFLIRRAGGGSSTAFTPAGGDLLIMRGRCQRDWQHCVPKQRSSASARMSLNFTSTAQALS